MGSSHGKVRCVRAKSKKPQCQSSSSQRVQKCKKSATTLKKIPRFGNTSLEIRKPVWLMTSGANTPEAQMTVAAATTKTAKDTEG